MNWLHKTAWLLALSAPLFATDVRAVAYCALRDPVNTIYEFFPEADNYRSGVETIGRDTRAEILKQTDLPLHFNEIGRHTLYIAQLGSETLGFVHARSEMGSWGLVEFAWAINPDLTVRDVRVQRTRDPALLRGDVLEDLKTRVVGRNLDELKQALAVRDLAPVGDDDRDLLGSMLRSAIKTLSVTSLTWADEIAVARPRWQAQRFYPTAARVQAVPDLYDVAVTAALAGAQLPDSPALRSAAIAGYRVLDANGNLLGLVFQSRLDVVSPDLLLWWSVDRSGTIRDVSAEVAAEVPPEFQQLRGFSPVDVGDCAGLADLLALELAILARHHGT